MKPLPGIPIEGQPNSVMLRLCVWAEARGEPTRGKLAVACVIQNRAEKKGKGIKEIVLAPWQFSSFNHDDPNRGKLLMAFETDPRGWSACDAVCDLLEADLVIDPTNGANHYYVVAMADPPEWGRGHPDWEEKAVIGRHVFGNAA